MYVYNKKKYILFFSVIDAFGNILQLLIGFFYKRKESASKRILLIRIDHMGDVITAMSILEPMHKGLPNAKIDVMVPSWAKNIVDGNSHINNIIEFNPPWFSRKPYGFSVFFKAWSNMRDLIRNGKYDTVIDLRGDVRHIAAMFFGGVRNRIGYGITGGGFLLTREIGYNPHLHETDKNMLLLKPLGVYEPAGSANIQISDKDRVKAEELKRISGISDKYAVMHVVPGHPDKKWTIEGFSRVIKYLWEKKGIKTVLVGTDADSSYIASIIGSVDINAADISGRTDIGMLSYILKGADLFVGVDSGPSHIASAMNIPSVILFSGANDPLQWAPRSSKVKVIYPGKGKSLIEIVADEVCQAIEEVI